MCVQGQPLHPLPQPQHLRVTLCRWAARSMLHAVKAKPYLPRPSSLSKPYVPEPSSLGKPSVPKSFSLTKPYLPKSSSLSKPQQASRACQVAPLVHQLPNMRDLTCQSPTVCSLEAPCLNPSRLAASTRQPS